MLAAIYHGVLIFSLDPLSQETEFTIKPKRLCHSVLFRNHTGQKKVSGMGRTTAPPKKAGRKTILRKVSGTDSDIFVACVKGKKTLLRKL